jgi:hypothetical protein
MLIVVKVTTLVDNRHKAWGCMSDLLSRMSTREASVVMESVMHNSEKRDELLMLVSETLTHVGNHQSVGMCLNLLIVLTSGETRRFVIGRTPFLIQRLASLYSPPLILKMMKYPYELVTAFQALANLMGEGPAEVDSKSARIHMASELCAVNGYRLLLKAVDVFCPQDLMCTESFSVELAIESLHAFTQCSPDISLAHTVLQTTGMPSSQYILTIGDIEMVVDRFYQLFDSLTSIEMLNYSMLLCKGLFSALYCWLETGPIDMKQYQLLLLWQGSGRSTAAGADDRPQPLFVKFIRRSKLPPLQHMHPEVQSVLSSVSYLPRLKAIIQAENRISAPPQPDTAGGTSGRCGFPSCLYTDDIAIPLNNKSMLRKCGRCLSVAYWYNAITS